MMHTPSALQISNLRFRHGGHRSPADSSPVEGSPGEGEPWTIAIASLALDRGEQMLLTGGSGSGKSTLLHLIAGLIDPIDGEVLIAGQNIHWMRGAERDLFRGLHIGMIFQTFNLLHGFSALENVMVAMMFSDIPRREHASRARALLQQLGITQHGRDPQRMSVGQQQRIAVARAVACEPTIVLADEPTASLDPDNSAAAMNLIQDACRERGIALLCVSHDPSMADRFARRHSLDELAARAIPVRPSHALEQG
jgi:ABC-type lipoprotein export system ATPase subunit